MKSLTLFFAALVSALILAAAPVAEPTAVVIVVGPGSHPPGTHEVAAGARVIAYCLEHADNIGGFSVQVFHEWPKDDAVLDRAAAIVFSGDTFPPTRLPGSAAIMQKLTAMMDRGCGIVCFHYATGLRGSDVTPDGDHPLLRWMGGYFATATEERRSIARIMDATVTPAALAHPVLRGWREFRLNDEPYYNNNFGPQGLAPSVTALATAMLPPEAPKREVLAWCVERPDGGRGIGIVLPHFFRNWRIDDLRTFILNGVVWAARREVPADGVRSVLPDLATFAPQAVEFRPRAPKTPAAAPKP